ncbi:MAG: MFS transporter, partial [Alphaproteobacteria bacterium]|nr:MFS transporter [Alphaproteobacteria bacterium]
MVAGLFFLSGFSALIYQIAWQRLLGLFGGADTIAATLVVSAFLAGLGIGSLFGGLVADRFERRRALLLFALCEIAIACYAALSVWIFYDLLFVGLIELSRSRALVFTLAFVSLMAPTILMGLSLPLLSRALVDNVDGAARRIGGLYAINTLGAGAGALVAGFWLIGSFGYQTAILTGAVLNAVVGLGGLLAARAKGRSALDRPVVVSTQVAHADTKMVHRWCALVFVAGFLTVAVQVEWYRLFGTMMQGNAYGFALILGVFLIGDAIGLYIGARRASAIQDPRRVFLLLQGVTVLIAAGGVYLVYLLTGWAPARGLLVHADDFVISPHRSAAVAGTVVVMVFAASVVMGFTFPLSQRAVQSDATLIGHRVGIIQLA